MVHIVFVSTSMKVVHSRSEFIGVRVLPSAMMYTTVMVVHSGIELSSLRVLHSAMVFLSGIVFNCVW